MRYYLNTNTKQVHRAGCTHLEMRTKKAHKHYLGKFSSLKSAVLKANSVLHSWARQAGRSQPRRACICHWCSVLETLA